MRCYIFFFLLLAACNAGAISLAEAVDRVREDTSGEVLSATTIKEDGKPVHRLKVLLPNGKVRIVKIPKDPINKKDE